ncbi:MAG: MFS transporter [Anaerolineae bacterium]
MRDSAPYTLAAGRATPDARRRLARYRWILFSVVGLAGMQMYFHFSWGATLSRYHTLEWKLDAGQLGLLSAMLFIPFALAQIPGGYLTDRLGGRKVLSLVMLLLALGTAIFAGAPNFTLALIGRMLLGLGTGVIFTPALKVLARWFRAGEFATVQGGFILLGTFGSVMGTWPLAVAAESWGWRPPMWAVAGLTSLVAAAIWFLVRDDPVELGLPAITTFDPAAISVQAAPMPATKLPSLRTSFRLWYSLPTLWAISLILLATSGTLWSFQSLWAGPLLRHVRHLSVIETGSALLMFTLGKAVGPLVFGFISDRLARARKPIVIFSVLAETGVWLLIILTFEHLPLPVLYVAFAAVSALSGGALVTQAMIKELIPPHLFGTIYGIINGSGFYGAAGLQLIIGAVLKASSPVTIAGEPVYSAQAYMLALSPMIIFMLIAVVFSFRLSETFGLQTEAN